MNTRPAIALAAAALVILAGCGSEPGDSTPSPASSAPSPSPSPDPTTPNPTTPSMTPTSQPSAASSTPATTLPPTIFEEYDVQPRQIEVGGTITITAACDLHANSDVVIETSDQPPRGNYWWIVPPTDYTSTDDGHWKFVYKLALDNTIGPGAIAVIPECVGIPDDPAPNQRTQSRFVPGYEPIMVTVTERATGPAWASYRPLNASVAPTFVPAGGAITATAVCPPDATPGLGRIILFDGYQFSVSGFPPEGIIAVIDVPADAYTIDATTGTGTYTATVTVDQINPNGTLILPVCTPGVDGGLPPIDDMSMLTAVSAATETTG